MCVKNVCDKVVACVCDKVVSVTKLLCERCVKKLLCERCV